MKLHTYKYTFILRMYIKDVTIDYETIVLTESQS